MLCLKSIINYISNEQKMKKALTLSIINQTNTEWSKKKFMMWSGGEVFKKF